MLYYLQVNISLQIVPLTKFSSFLKGEGKKRGSLGVCYSKINSPSISSFKTEAKTLSPRTEMKKAEEEIFFEGLKDFSLVVFSKGGSCILPNSSKYLYLHGFQGMKSKKPGSSEPCVTCKALALPFLCYHARMLVIEQSL